MTTSFAQPQDREMRPQRVLPEKQLAHSNTLGRLSKAGPKIDYTAVRALRIGGREDHTLQKLWG